MKLFISYSHTDKWQVQQIVELLKQGGHAPWFNTELLPGQSWQDETNNQIKNCEVFIYLLSPESVKDHWCQWEFQNAVKFEKPIIPILIQSNTEIPETISKHQYLDVSQGLTPESTAKLMGGLMQIAISVPKAEVPDVEVPKESKPARAEQPQKHVFISYSRHDTGMMIQIRDRLKGKNIPVWTDESIKTGAPHWQTVIEKAIENAGCVLVILSPDAKESEWVRKEIYYARARNIQVIAVLIRGDESNAVPFDILGSQHIDLQKDYQNGIEEAIQTVREYTLKIAEDMPVDEGEKAKEHTVSERFWNRLMRVISKQKCTPFVGSGLDTNFLTSRAEIARLWAKQHNYPFSAEYEHDLARVGHYITLDLDDPAWSKEEIIDMWYGQIDFDEVLEKNDAYKVLAGLDFPVYVTTNYHDLLYQALWKEGKKPQRVFWHDKKWQTSYDELKNIATAQEPMVFHIYGHISEPESLILTEYDYLNFLIQIVKNEIEFPPVITGAIGKSTYLFAGFTVTDWNLRILFHVLSKHGRTGKNPHLAVQVEPLRELEAPKYEESLKRYLENCFRDHIGSVEDVYVGDSVKFIQELRERLDKELSDGN